MSPTRLATAFRMNARELVRGRIVLLMLLVIPTVFYAIAVLTTQDTPLAFELAALGDSPVVIVPQRDEALVFIGLAAVGILTAFLAMRLAQRDVEVNRRLVLCGYRPWELVLAKLAVLCVVITLVSAWVVAILPLFFDAQHFALVYLGFALIGWIYGCYGLLVGALTRRELEGILFVALLANIDAGWLQNPVWYGDAQNQAVIRALPAHLPSQVAMAAAFTDHPVHGALALGFLYGLSFLGLALGMFAWRMGRRG